jgi:hypothetical protein
VKIDTSGPGASLETRATKTAYRGRKARSARRRLWKRAMQQYKAYYARRDR